MSRQYPKQLSALSLGVRLRNMVDRLDNMFWYEMIADKHWVVFQRAEHGWRLWRGTDSDPSNPGINGNLEEVIFSSQEEACRAAANNIWDYTLQARKEGQDACKTSPPEGGRIHRADTDR